MLGCSGGGSVSWELFGEAWWTRPGSGLDINVYTHPRGESIHSGEWMEDIS